MISIVYPIKNRRTLFSKTIDSIYKYKSNITIPFEIILTDSGSSDGIEEYVKSLKDDFDIRYILYDYHNIKYPHNPAYAINLGVRLSKYDSVVISFSEVLHNTPVIEQLKEYVGKNVLCKVYDLNEEGKPYRLLYGNESERKNDPGFYFLAMYNKNDFVKLGGINEEYMGGIGYEDKDFGLRFKRNNLQYSVTDEIIGSHQWHPRLNSPDILYRNGCILNKYRRCPEYTIANTSIQFGDEKYIVSII